MQTDQGAICNFRFAAPCPQLGYGETLRATTLQSGRSTLVVRAIDAGGNVVERGPYEVEVVTPSDRGAFNGGDATEGSRRLSGRLAGKRPRRSVDIVAQGRAGPRGRLRTFADGAIGRDGRFRVSYRFRDPASRGRTFQFRIKIERDSGFAYWGGYSRIARVKVR